MSGWPQRTLSAADEEDPSPRGLQSGIAWAVHKEVLVRRGLIDHAAVRVPARELDTRARAGLAAILDRLDLQAGTIPLTGIR